MVNLIPWRKNTKKQSQEKRQSERVAPLPKKAKSSASHDDDNNNNNSSSDAKKEHAVFWQIQIQSGSQWGLLRQMTAVLQNQGLTIIDHRTWNDRRAEDPQVVNEIHCRDVLSVSNDRNNNMDSVINARKATLEKVLKENLNESKVSIQQWYPDQQNAPADASSESPPTHATSRTKRRQKARSVPTGGSLFGNDNDGSNHDMHSARMYVDGRMYNVRIDDSSLQTLRRGDLDQPINVHPQESPLDHLQGLVR